MLEAGHAVGLAGRGLGLVAVAGLPIADFMPGGLSPACTTRLVAKTITGSVANTRPKSKDSHGSSVVSRRMQRIELTVENTRGTGIDRMLLPRGSLITSVIMQSSGL